MGTSMAVMGLAVLAVLGAGLFIAFKLFQGIVWLLIKVFSGIGFLLKAVFALLRGSFRHLGGFGKNMAVDGLHTVGAVLTAAAIIPLTIGNLLIGRWSSARHYGRALEDEAASAGLGLYRIAISHPLRLVGLKRLIEGVERRLPDIIDRAPRAKIVKGEFPGYQVLGTLPTGGSGAHLYVARPLAETFQRFHEMRRGIADEVVIKSFALEQGSTLPQIVRESRALEAAGKLGLVYEHKLSPERFYYVMPYVKGKELNREIHRLHARSNPEGLSAADLELVTGYAIDVLSALERFHTGGLWHKDVKPANLIVEDGRVHLVDFGLVTSLASALTLTTHGTEYYRDPEMVRLAMQGVKVHEVDGVRFDLYSSGAVLYSMIENSFPAHGSLSKISKRCPEAMRWIVNRAMADMRARYGSAREMREDLLYLVRSADPFAVRPGELPSFTGEAMPNADLPPAPSVPGSAPLQGGTREDRFVNAGFEPFRSIPPLTAGEHAAKRFKHVAQVAAATAASVGGKTNRWASGWRMRHSDSARAERRRRRRPGRFVAAAMILMLGLLALQIIRDTGSDWRRSQGLYPDQWAQSTPSAPRVRFETDRLPREDVELVNGLKDVFDDLGIEDPYLVALDRMIGLKIGALEQSVDVHAAEIELPTEDPPGDMGSESLLGVGPVMILTGLNSEVSDQRVDSLRVHLVANGFDVLIDSDRSNELEAKAHSEILMGAFDDELTHFQLRTFLAAHSKELAAIVLLDGTDEEPVYRTLGPAK